MNIQSTDPADPTVYTTLSGAKTEGGLGLVDVILLRPLEILYLITHH